MSDDTVREGLPLATGAALAPKVPGYECLRVLGRGGMGIVWEALELRLDRHVALKVQAQVDADAAAMWAEAKLAARVGDPGVVTVFDVGHTFDGRAFYTMELVDGTDLAALLQDGALPVARAVRLATDIAHAVAAAHDKGIVHRDLKPRNVMVDQHGRARVLDFGLARRTDDAEKGPFAGSPPYMCPEQVRGQRVGPAGDVWALGVMLFEMLAGRRPFVAPEQPGLLYAIAFEVPPTLGSLVAIPADLERLVMSCLAKEPTQRFPSARALADVLCALRDGKPAEPMQRRRATAANVTRPARPTRDQAQRVFRWSWSLRSSPEQLWPHLADTDCFNEAVGLGQVDVELAREGPGTIARAGHATALGLELRWREYPFEWIRDQEHTVFRWYRQGPLEALWNRVSLERRADGGTDLTHEIAVIPRGVLGRVAALVEIGQRLRRAMDRVYQEVDANLGAGRDPYDLGHDPTPAERVRIDVSRAKLLEAGFEVASVDALCEMLETAPARKLARLRPFALAPALQTTRERALELMLHAAHIGLLEISWDLVCPTCMVAHDREAHLDQVTSHARCVVCETDYDRDLGTSVELVLRPHPDVRATKLQTYCAGSPAARAHVLVQLVLDPGEERTIHVALPPGEYAVAAFGVTAPAELAVSAVGFGAEGEVIVEDRAVAVRPAVLAHGTAALRFVNDSSEERSVRIEKQSARAEAVPATLALTHPTFRDFFARELLSYGQLLGVSHLTFVVVDATDGALFAERGDAAACAALRAFETAFEDVLRQQGGARLPGPLETLIAAFPSGVPALTLALSLLDHTDIPVRAAVHGGRCLALTREARVEYFGETLHRTLWLARAAEVHGLVLSQAAAGDHEIAVALHAMSVSTQVDVTRAGPYQGRRIVRVALRKES